MRLNRFEAVRLPQQTAVGTSAMGQLVVSASTGQRGVGVGRWPDVQRAARIAEDLLRDDDPRAAPAHYQRLVEGLSRNDEFTPSLRAVAIIDQALWDLKAQAAGEPLWRLLGGSGHPVRAALRLTASRWDDPLLAAGGFRAAVLEAGDDPEQTGQTARAVLEELAGHDPLPDLTIALAPDTSPGAVETTVQAWTAKMDIARVEFSFSGGPVPWQALRELADRTPAAVSVRDTVAASLFPDLAAFAIDVVVIDPELRGITGSLQLAEAAYGYELPVVLAVSPGRFAAHFAGVLPTLAAVEVDADDRDLRGLVPGIRAADGALVLDDAPGIGWARSDGGTTA